MIAFNKILRTIRPWLIRLVRGWIEVQLVRGQCLRHLSVQAERKIFQILPLSSFGTIKDQPAVWIRPQSWISPTSTGKDRWSFPLLSVTAWECGRRNVCQIKICPLFTSWLKSSHIPNGRSDFCSLIWVTQFWGPQREQREMSWAIANNLNGWFSATNLKCLHLLFPREKMELRSVRWLERHEGYELSWNEGW